MKYFDLLKSNTDNASTLRHIEQIESNNGIELPVIYKSLISIYDLSSLGTERVLSYYNTKYDAKIQFYKVKNRVDENISIEQWFTVDEIFDKTRKLYSDEPILQEKYLAIGESFDQGILLLGLESTNSDEIFIDHLFSVPRIKMINKNVLDFLYDFEITPMQSDLPDGSKIEDLYKNWGEDFWRVREE